MADWIPAALAGVIGLVGIIVGASLTAWRDRVARRSQFVKQQVQEFYSPLVGIRREIRAKSELRVKISSVADDVWVGLCEGKDPGALQELDKNTFPKFEKIIKYDNMQLGVELLPSYRRILDLFRENMWLAEESTKLHYQNLVEYVEIWNRWVSESLPSEVAKKLDHSESLLNPLYEDLEQQLRRLRSQLADGIA